MTSNEAIRKAVKLKLLFVAIDLNGDICGYKERPIYNPNTREWWNSKDYNDYTLLGKYYTSGGIWSIFNLKEQY